MMIGKSIVRKVNTNDLGGRPMPLGRGFIMFSIMFSFHKQIRYLSVHFLNSRRAYTYKTADPRINVNDVVLVPVGETGELKPAIVSRVENEPPPYFPEDKIKSIKGIAGKKDRALFAGVDMRMPFDISWYRKEIDGKVYTIVTTQEQRAALRRTYAGDPSVRLTEERFPTPAPSHGKTPAKKSTVSTNDNLKWIDEIEGFAAFIEDE